ncbi:MAG: type II toxin-antitoxin system RelE/ParE family toxin [Bacteroidetes bacterium]|nr:type II toxin-antitoxin system RelE/ParE family toxin [Bacteroidota bacterium]
MPYTIVWSPKARITYYKILDYLDEQWTFREIENFIDRTEQALTHISRNPLLYQYSQDSNAYRCVLVKQVSLFYRIRSNEVQLLIFWNNRQDPVKLFL